MKKTYLYLVQILLFTTISCGSDSGNDLPEPEEENTAPTTPSLIYPSNNEVCIDNNIVFEWGESTDAEGNRITYNIEIAENNSFSPILQTTTSFSQSKLIPLTTRPSLTSKQGIILLATVISILLVALLIR